MNLSLLLIPLLGMWILTFLVWVSMFFTRAASLKSTKTSIDALQDPQVKAAAYSSQTVNAGDNFSNLCELPIIFYGVCLTIILFQVDDQFYLLLASLFTLFRYIHSFIHLTYNRVSHRFAAYFLSGIAMWLMVGRFAWQLLTN